MKATVYNLRFQLRAAGVLVTSVQRQLQFAWIVVLRFFDPWLLLGKVWDTTFLLSLNFRLRVGDPNTYLYIVFGLDVSKLIGLSHRCFSIAQRCWAFCTFAMTSTLLDAIRFQLFNVASALLTLDAALPYLPQVWVMEGKSPSPEFSPVCQFRQSFLW